MIKTKSIFMKILFLPVLILVALIWCVLFLFKKAYQNKMFKNLNINIIDTLSGYDFEEVVAVIFKAKGFKVVATPKSNDYGADIIATKKKQKIVVQTKLYYNHSVGNKAVQEVHTAKDYYDAQIAMVVTNWTFSRQAIEMANKLNVKLISRIEFIELLDSFKTRKGKHFFNKYISFDDASVLTNNSLALNLKNK